MKRIAILALCLWTGLRVCADEQPWISLPGDAFELKGELNHQIINIPVVLDAGIKLKDVTVDYNRPIYIRLGKKYDQGYLEGFTLLPFKLDSAPAILMDVDLTRIRTTGTYQVYLSFSVPGRKTNYLSISIIRPDAKLQLPQTIHIDMVGNDIVRADPFFLIETANVNINGLPLQPPLFSGVNKDNLLTFDSARYSLPARSRLCAVYTPNKDAISALPIGKTTGKMEIYAPEMGAPVTIDFEITNKASTWWIFWLLLTGVATGAFVRQYLKYKKDVDEKKLDGFDLLNKIKVETADITDEGFTSDIKPIREKLESKLQERVFPNNWNRYINELGALITEKAATYAELRKNFDARAVKVRNTLTSLSFLFGDNRLTPAIKDQLKPAQELYQAGRADALDWNITGAENNLRQSIDAVNDAINGYSAAVTQLVNDDGSHLYPDTVTQSLKDAIKQRCQIISPLVQKLNGVATDADGLTGEVRAADTVQLKLQSMLAFLLEMTGLLFNTDWINDDSELSIKFKASMEAWEKNIGDIIQNPLQPVNTVHLDELSSNWKKVISAKAKKEQVLGDTDQPKRTVMGGATAFSLLSSPMVLGNVSPIDLPTQEVLLRRAIYQVRLSWLMTTILQSGFIFLLIFLTAYLFYAPSFTGTVQEKISLFIFAFGLNISLESLNLIRDRKPGAIN